ncbi:hypothetical protein HN014_21705 [Aquimarina sp. TRL1]|uniref:DUF7010 family protein n=1 Tax=Aquimarina sp. (strain TRL1) TaxID=2736252 RepID=UPI00158BA18A|nr:hypothetical protein [Aquimarina sp. TRL1]QKX07418.1 hypothetical protein HN014_21705 [Aquimarina sp. TRL1]
MTQNNFGVIKSTIQQQAKKGIDFITAGTIVWIGISFIWMLDYTPYNKSVITFIFGTVMLPLAFGLSKVFKTNWKIKDNPLQPLGLWLNFAQLFYFPLLVFVLLKQPDYFIMAYAIITGAHFFPYAWFYDEIGYLIAAGIIAIGALLIALLLPQSIYYIPIGTAIILALLAIKIISSNKYL